MAWWEMLEFGILTLVNMDIFLKCGFVMLYIVLWTQIKKTKVGRSGAMQNLEGGPTVRQGCKII